MRATAILPIKRFGAAKSRLSGAVPGEARRALAAAMLTDVLVALGGSNELERVLVVSGEPIAIAAAGSAGVRVIDDPADGGHSEAAVLGVQAAIGAGAGCVAILPGDCPLLNPRELDSALAEHAGKSVGVIPDRHGSGTNGLLLSPPDAIRPAFGPGSRERHLCLAEDAGMNSHAVEIPSLALDLDTPDDLDELASRLQASPDLAPFTAAAIAQVLGAGR
jgi:2-phospho-L-lactate/phosphoenolpyruvate guanylyltransferase